MNAIDQLRNYQQRLIEQQSLKLIPPPLSLQPQRRLQEMSRLREKVQEYNIDRKKPFEQVLTELDFKRKYDKQQIDPTKSTLADIDRLISDYIKSGLKDPIYLNNLYKLRTDYLQKAQNTGYYVHHPTPSLQSYPYQNSNYYSKESQLTNTNSSNPYLSSINSLPFVPKIRQRTEAIDKNEYILQYMRQEEAQALVEAQRTNSLDRYQRVLNVKTQVETEIIKERAKELANKITFQYNYDDNDYAVPYSDLEGFIIRWDFVSKLAITVNSARLAFGIFRKDEEFHPFKQTTDQMTQGEDYRSNKCIFRQQEYMQDIVAHQTSTLYIELWGFVLGNEFEPEFIGWTLFKLFDHIGSLLVGKYKLPFYGRKYKPNNLLDGAVYPYQGNQCIFLRILQPNNQIHDDQIFIENDYRIPVYHIHRDCKIIKDFEQPELPKISFEYDKPLREREPQMFQEYKKQSVPSLKSNLKIPSQVQITLPTQTDTPQKNTGLNTGRNTAKNRKFTRVSAMKKRQYQPAVTSNNLLVMEENEIAEEKIIEIPKGILTLKIIKLQYLNASEYKGIKIKIGIFVDQIVIKDRNDNDCVAQQELVSMNEQDDAMFFDYSTEFLIDYQELKSQFKSELEKAFIYMAFYKEKELFGWYVPELIKQNAFNSGVHIVNLILPPGQQAPFNEQKMLKSNIKLQFVLMSNSEKQSNLDIVDKYQKQKEETIREVKNPNWNTQITILINELYYFPSKDNCNICQQIVSIKVALIDQENVILDVLQRKCLNEGDLDAFSTKDRYIYTSTYYACFRVGTAYLKENYPKQLSYAITINSKNTLLGVSQIPMFKKDLLQIGYMKTILYDINNKKTKFSIGLIIKETPLQLDVFEQTPGYVMDREAGGYTRKNQQVQQQEEPVQSNYNPITITVSHVQIETTLIKLSISDGKYLLLDENSDECKAEFTRPQKVLFNIPLSQMENQPNERYQLIAEIYLENQLQGWMAINLMFSGKLYTTKLFTELFKPPIQKCPVDFKTVKKLRSKIEIQIEQGNTIKQTKQELSKVIKKKTDSTITINIQNLPTDGIYEIKVELRNERKIIQDRQLTPCQTIKEIKINQGGYRDFNVQYNLLKTEMPQDTLIFIYLLKDKIEIRWCYAEIYQKGQVISGKLEKKMLFPPFQKPPIQKNTKTTTTDIGIEID